MTRAAALALAAVALCGGCGGGGAGSAQESASDVTPDAAVPAPDGGPPIPLGCEHAVPQSTVEVPEGLLRPGAARILASSAQPRADDPRITIVEGYVELLPGDLVRGFAKRDGMKVLFSEDEQIEGEVLVSDGRHRNFWKAIRTCFAASRFTALVAAEASGGAVSGQAKPNPKRRRR